MSLRDVSFSKPILAKKGGATPVSPGVLRANPVTAPLRPIENDGEISLDVAPADTATETESGPAAAEAMESAPAASLLPFDLLRKKYRPDASPDLVEDEPDIVLGDLTAASEPGPQAELALRTEPEPAKGPELRAPVETAPEPALRMPALKAPQPSKPGVKPGAMPWVKPGVKPGAKPGAKPSIDAPAVAPTPTPNPEWRVGIKAMTPPKRPRGGGWLLPFAAAAAAFAALVAGWHLSNSDIDLGFGSAPETVTAGETTSDETAADETVADETVADETVAVDVEPPPPVVESSPPLAPDAPALIPPASTAVAEPEPAPEAAAGSDSNSGETPVETAAEEPQAAQAVDETQAAVLPPEAVDPDSTVVEAAAPELSPAQVPAQVPAQTPVEPVVGEQAASNQIPAAVEPAIIKPTVDVVRLEASGEAVIAGRAAPNSELIVLDNGEPIGSAKADAFGEWVFVPAVALPSGDHEFGLVVKTVQESVMMPAPETPPLPPAPEPEPALTAPEPAPVAPADVSSNTESGAATDTVIQTGANPDPDVAPAVGMDGTAAQPIPVPARKPEPANAAAAPADEQAAISETADFVVQLASVKTRAGAEQEWRKLKQRFPEILSNMVPALDEVKLAEFGTMIRVRTGAFDSQRDAANLCARLVAKSQACLVVKTSGGN